MFQWTRYFILIILEQFFPETLLLRRAQKKGQFFGRENFIELLQLDPSDLTEIMQFGVA